MTSGSGVLWHAATTIVPRIQPQIQSGHAKLAEKRPGQANKWRGVAGCHKLTHGCAYFGGCGGAALMEDSVTTSAACKRLSTPMLSARFSNKVPHHDGRRHIRTGAMLCKG